MNYKYKITVKALVFHNGKILLLKRSEKANGDKYYYEFPGGGLEFRESPEEALKREIMEEAGIEVEIISPLYTWNMMKNEETEIIGITFLCRTENHSVILSNEHSEYVWTKYEEMDKLDIRPGILEDLKKVNIEDIYYKLNIK